MNEVRNEGLETWENMINPIEITADPKWIDWSDIYRRPELQRLSTLIADKIMSDLSKLPENEELIIAKISWFPGLSEMSDRQSSQSIWADHIKHLLVSSVIWILKEKWVIGFRYYENFKPQQSDQLWVKLSITNDNNSYWSNGRGSFIYKKSIFEIRLKKSNVVIEKPAQEELPKEDTKLLGESKTRTAQKIFNILIILKRSFSRK